MKIIVSHMLLDATAAQTQAIAEAFGAEVPFVAAVDMKPVNTKHVIVQHRIFDDGVHDVEIVVSDEAIIRAMGIYVKIAQFVGPIVKSCVAFAETLGKEIDGLAAMLKE